MKSDWSVASSIYSEEVGTFCHTVRLLEPPAKYRESHSRTKRGF